MTTETTPARWYKVLVNGESCHGGALTWSLPQQQSDGSWTPGAWHEVAGRLRVCSNGLHLTNAPVNWMKPGATVYLADPDGAVAGPEGDKIAVQRARLLRPLTSAELAELLIFNEGEHHVENGHAWASGSATVEAYGSATVEAYDSATVEAYGSATVRAYGSATVRAYDSATVRAYDSATVRAYDSATVEASGSATVEASGSATVEASGSATVNLSPWYIVQAVTVTGEAVCIDRRHTPPLIIVGGVPYAPQEARSGS